MVRARIRDSFSDVVRVMASVRRRDWLELVRVMVRDVARRLVIFCVKIHVKLSHRLAICRVKMFKTIEFNERTNLLRR